MRLINKIQLLGNICGILNTCIDIPSQELQTKTMPVNPNLGVPIAGPLREISQFLVDTTPGQEALYAPFSVWRPTFHRIDEAVLPVVSQLNEMSEEAQAKRLEDADFALQNDQAGLWRSREHDIFARTGDGNRPQVYVAPHYLPKYRPGIFDPKQLDIFDVRPVRATSIMVPPGEGIRVKNEWVEFSLEGDKPNNPQEAVMTNEPTLKQLDVSFEEVVEGGLRATLEVMHMTPHDILESPHVIGPEDRYKVPLFYIRRLAEIGLVDVTLATTENNDDLNRVLLGTRAYRVDLQRLAGDFPGRKPTPQFRVFDAEAVTAADISLFKTMAEQPFPLITFYGPKNHPSDEEYRKKSETTFLR